MATLAERLQSMPDVDPSIAKCILESDKYSASRKFLEQLISKEERSKIATLSHHLNKRIDARISELVREVKSGSTMTATAAGATDSRRSSPHTRPATTPTKRDLKGWTHFHDAVVREGSFAAVKALVDARAEVNARDRSEDTKTLLHIIVADYGDPTMVKVLLNAGADLEVLDGDGWTPLHWATGLGQSAAIVKELLDAGANIEAKTNSGNTPWDLAQKNDSLKGHEVCQRLTKEDWTSLHDAALKEKSREAVQALVDAGADINAKDKHGYPLVHLSVWLDKSPSMAAILAEAGADLDIKSDLGWTCLHTLADENRPDLIKALVDAGANLETRDNYGTTALHLAARRSKFPATVRALIDAGADINAKDNHGNTPWDLAQKNDFLKGHEVRQRLRRKLEGWTSLHDAARREKSREAVQALVDAGADINAKYKDEYTLLHLSVWRDGSPSMVAILAEAGADLNIKSCFGRTCLHILADENRPDLVKALVDAGANLETRSNSGRTALHLAAQFSEFPATVRALIDAGADINAKDDHGNTPWDLAQENDSLKRHEVCQRLRRNLKGWTSLHDAALKEKSREAVQALVDAGADINAKDKEGYPLVHLSVWLDESPSMAAILAEAGADLNIKSCFGRTCLHILADENRPDLVKALVDAGANLETRDNYGNTALHLAAESSEFPATVRALIDAGADINAKDDHGNTPWDLAQKNDSLKGHEVCQRLRRKLEGWTSLHDAARREKSREAVKALVDAGADINAKHDNKYTLLHLSVWRDGSSSMAAILAEAGADLNIKSCFGRTCLHNLASGGRPDLVKALIDAEADLEAKVGGRTALHIAVESGQSRKVVQVLLDAGASTEMPPGQRLWDIARKGTNQDLKKSWLYRRIQFGL